MFRTIVAVCSILSVAAFAPARMARAVSSLKMGFESEIGAQAPLGFWDPLGLLADADAARFARLRTVEVNNN